MCIVAGIVSTGKVREKDVLMKRISFIDVSTELLAPLKDFCP